MVNFNFLTSACSLLLLLPGRVTANPLKKADDFNFKTWVNRLDCPMAGGTKYTSINEEKFGILCGWDTHSRTYHWGPITDVNFEECIRKCAALDECTVATFTGTCYLKKNARGKGYVRTGRKNNMTAIKLKHHRDHKD